MRSGAGLFRRSSPMDLDQILTIPLGDTRYPAALAAIHDPPPVLWTKGRAESLRGPMVAIVGSRAASPYALEVARRLGADLARRTRHGGQRHGARRGFGGAPGRARRGRRHGRRVRVRRRRHLSARARRGSPRASASAARCSASSRRARRRCPPIFRSATASSAGCRSPSSSSRRRRRAAR